MIAPDHTPASLLERVLPLTGIREYRYGHTRIYGQTFPLLLTVHLYG
jgi:hypothetical protein